MSLRIFKQIHRTSCSKIPFADFIKFFIWLFDWSPITPHRHFSLKGNITDCTGCNRRGSLGRWRRADCRRATLSGCQSKRKRFCPDAIKLFCSEKESLEEATPDLSLMEAGLHSGAQSHCLNKRLPVERTKMCQGKSPKLSSELKYQSGMFTLRN